MSDPQDTAPAPAQSPPGLYDPGAAGRVSRFELIASGLTVLWLLACVAYGLFLRPEDEGDLDRLTLLMTAMAVLFPVAMIWVGATAARASEVMRAESVRLQAAIDAIRKSYIAQNQGGVSEPSLGRKLDEIAATTRKLEAALAMFATARADSAETARGAIQGDGATVQDDQPALALGTPPEEMAPPLELSDFIRALNFPETAEDVDGFASLRLALKDRSTAQLVQASQDVLTLMSQDGIYMDDLRPDLARTEIWRAFAAGERGRAIAPLGGVHDRTSLALAYGRMKQDPIFRDAAHHFLRIFDKTFVGFAERASDTEIQAFAGTRTARAFMLLGRIAGTFD